MKLFCFEEKGSCYAGSGSDYFIVMSESKEQALQAVKDYLMSRVKDWQSQRDDILVTRTVYYFTWCDWKDTTIDKLPDTYHIREIQPNEIFHGEWA